MSTFLIFLLSNANYIQAIYSKRITLSYIAFRLYFTYLSRYLQLFSPHKFFQSNLNPYLASFVQRGCLTAYILRNTVSSLWGRPVTYDLVCSLTPSSLSLSYSYLNRERVDLPRRRGCPTVIPSLVHKAWESLSLQKAAPV